MVTISLEGLDQKLRAVLAICPSPSAHDVVTIHRTPKCVVVTFPDHRLTFAPTDPNLPLAMESFKKKVRRCTEAQRQRAMRDDAGLTPDARPLWLVSSHELVAEWIGWIGGQQKLEQQWGGSDHRACPILLHAEISDLEMSLTGQIYDHDMRCDLILSARPRCTFSDRIAPKLIIRDNVVPETVTVLTGRTVFGNVPALGRMPADAPIGRPWGVTDRERNALSIIRI